MKELKNLENYTPPDNVIFEGWILSLVKRKDLSKLKEITTKICCNCRGNIYPIEIYDGRTMERGVFCHRVILCSSCAPRFKVDLSKEDKLKLIEIDNEFKQIAFGKDVTDRDDKFIQSLINERANNHSKKVKGS